MEKEHGIICLYILEEVHWVPFSVADFQYPHMPHGDSIWHHELYFEQCASHPQAISLTEVLKYMVNGTSTEHLQLLTSLP